MPSSLYSRDLIPYLLKPSLKERIASFICSTDKAQADITIRLKTQKLTQENTAHSREYGTSGSPRNSLCNCKICVQGGF